MSKFKVGDKVWIDKTPYPINMPKGIMGEVVEILSSNAYGVINPYNKLNEFPWAFMENQLKAIEPEKAKPTIIHLSNAKIVINKPYVIVTDGKHTGKAKCNPDDVWSVETGLELAVKRYKTEMKYFTGGWGSPKPKAIKERFPIGINVSIYRKSDKPWIGFQINDIAKVIGYTSSWEYGTLLKCAREGNIQMVNPDDVDVVITRTYPNIEPAPKLL